MSIRFDSTAGDFVLDNETHDCGRPMYDTGCPAPGCSGWGCTDCGEGCAYGLVEDSPCAQALAAESETERAERINTERAAFGLSPLA